MQIVCLVYVLVYDLCMFGVCLVCVWCTVCLCLVCAWFKLGSCLFFGGIMFVIYPTKCWLMLALCSV